MSLSLCCLPDASQPAHIIGSRLLALHDQRTLGHTSKIEIIIINTIYDWFTFMCDEIGGAGVLDGSSYISVRDRELELNR